MDRPPTEEEARPLGRGLKDISHLFLSPRTVDPGAVSEPSSPREDGHGSTVVLRSATVTRDRVAAMLVESAEALEPGLRAFDAAIPCHPCGVMDVLAVDRGGRLTVIDFDTAPTDGLLLRALGHLDWLMHNLPNVQRMYRTQAVNWSLPPRLFVLAPEFSSLLRSAARQLTRPQIQWVRYHVAEAPAGLGILFESPLRE